MDLGDDDALINNKTENDNIHVELHECACCGCIVQMEKWR